jgi:hypothetical protein
MLSKGLMGSGWLEYRVQKTPGEGRDEGTGKVDDPSR